MTYGWWLVSAKTWAWWDPDLSQPSSQGNSHSRDSASEVKQSGVFTTARAWPVSGAGESVDRQGCRTSQMLYQNALV